MKTATAFMLGFLFFLGFAVACMAGLWQIKQSGHLFSPSGGFWDMLKSILQIGSCLGFLAAIASVVVVFVSSIDSRY